MVAPTEILGRLAHDDFEILGRLPWASNATLLVRVGGAKETGAEHEAVETAGVETGGFLAVYKPRRGERPLWDFPRGTLCQREVAAYEVSQALGWAIVPPTVLRDGPLGEGMLQLFVDHDPEQHYFTLRAAHTDRFAEFALFDVVANNADRKAGHCLLGADGHIWGIDHGVAFHASMKLRTVIWDYEGEPISGKLLAGLERLGEAFDGETGARLGRLLNHHELQAARGRLGWLRDQRVFPHPFTDHPYPWPMV